MVVVVGYSGYTGQVLSEWASGNNAFWSGSYVDITGLDRRIFDLELDLLNKVDEDTTFSDFAAVQTTFRNQINARLTNIETSVTDIKAALIAIRRTLSSHDTRIAALE